MHCLWIVVISSTLISLGALIVITVQDQMITIGKEQQRNLSSLLESVKREQTDAEFFKDGLENLMTLGNAKLKPLEAEMEKLDSEQKKKKPEADTCQTEKEVKQHELEEVEQTMKSLQETLKAESDVWSRDKETLRGQLTGYREICKYVRNNTIAMKRCGTPPSVKTIPQQG